MLNGIFVGLVVISILLAAVTGKMEQVTNAILQDSRTAVSLSIGLVGVMAFFLGLMKVAEDGGLLRVVARGISPVMSRLFPTVPPDHPAMSAMIMNIASNILGLGNAATPFGIKAMEELDTLNGEKGTATNAMVLFLAINTAGLAILPSGVVGIRAAAGSLDATGIFFPTWVASGTATLVAILAAMWLSRLPRYSATRPPDLPAERQPPAQEPVEESVGSSRWRRAATLIGGLAFVGLLVRHTVHAAREQPLHEWVRDVMSYWMLPAIVGSLVIFGWARGVRVYDSLVEGAKDGFNVALRIIPFLVAILVAIGMFRASGGIDLIVSTIGPVTALIGMPAEALPMAIMRPLSGSGALGVMTATMDAHGPDSLIGYMVSTYQGSTETTFYVLAVYFGAVRVTQTRHALPACLLADVAGILAGTFIVNLMYG
jgi:spore maturation protein SpmA